MADRVALWYLPERLDSRQCSTKRNRPAAKSAKDVAHLAPAVGVFDPKLEAYVVCITHSPDFEVGDLVPA